MAITSKKICIRKNGTTYSWHLHTNSNVGIKVLGVAVNVNGTIRTLYCPTVVTGTHTNNIHFRVSGTTFFSTERLPSYCVSYNIVNDPQPYKDKYRIDELTLKSYGGLVSITNKVRLQSKNGSSWVTQLTLPSGGTSISLSSVIRLADISNWRIQVLNTSDTVLWTSSTFSLGTGSGTSSNISIPEAYWGGI